MSTVASQVKVGLEGTDSRFGEETEPVGQGHLAVMVAVVVRAVRLLAVRPVLARLHFQEIRVVLLFLPTMGKRTLVLVGAARRI